MTQQTPLNKIHRQLGARMVDFAGWDMPVQYGSVIREHLAVRQKAGIFDVSHMGEIEVRGPQAEKIVQKATCNDITPLTPGDCQYSALLTERGTFVDDIIVNKITSDRFLICVNASNTDKDFEWIQQFSLNGNTIENVSDGYFQIALQGPEAEKMAKAAFGNTPLPVKPFTFLDVKISGQSCLVARTGYTAEDGFEIYGNPSQAESIWNVLMEKGAVPIGLGARDTLRLEAALSLYGHEINDALNPYEARLSWIVKLDKGDFVGREALLKIVKNPLEKKLVGFFMQEPGIARQGYKIFDGDEETGQVTSGTLSPSLDRAVALGYVKNNSSKTEKFAIDIHNKKRQAVITSLPFYRRKK